MRKEFYNYNGFEESSGKGGRASGGWVFDETLIRRVRLFAFFAPLVAKCLSFFFSILLFPIITYILLIIDRTYLCLITFLQKFFNSLNFSFLFLTPQFQLESS